MWKYPINNIPEDIKERTSHSVLLTAKIRTRTVADCFMPPSYLDMVPSSFSECLISICSVMGNGDHVGSGQTGLFVELPCQWEDWHRKRNYQGSALPRSTGATGSGRVSGPGSGSGSLLQEKVRLQWKPRGEAGRGRECTVEGENNQCDGLEAAVRVWSPGKPGAGGSDSGKTLAGPQGSRLSLAASLTASSPLRDSRKPLTCSATEPILLHVL